MKDHLKGIIIRAINKSAKGGDLLITDLPPWHLEPPKRKEFGDLATNVALVWGKKQGISPRKIAEKLLDNLEDPEKIIEHASIAGPGFLNFTFSAEFCYRRLGHVEEGTDQVVDLGHKKKIQVEFASVNPTGPLHVGHGRVAVIGDTLARLLEETGYNVEREYYVNDVGRQMENLGLSIYIRYKEIFGEKIEFPEEGYPGDYVKHIAERAREQWGDKFLVEEKDAAIAFLAQFGGDILLTAIQADLAEFGITFDSFFHERDLRGRGEVKETINHLQSQGVLYEEDGALWFRTTTFGDDKDRAIVKRNGDLTYFASDIAYHCNKLRRGYSNIINVWGADHHGYVSRLKASLQALGFEKERLHVVLVQMVHLTRAGSPVRMGKRKGAFVPLKDVLDEVGSDAARFIFLMRKADSHLDFDLELAKKESAENPVFYVQYAHARIASIFEQASKVGISIDDLKLVEVEIEQLTLPEELNIIKRIVQFTDVIKETVEELEPHRLTFYLIELASEFHRYYNRNRILSDNLPLTRARLLLVRNAQKIIRRGLHLLGLGAPIRMPSRSEPEGRQECAQFSEGGSVG